MHGFTCGMDDIMVKKEVDEKRLIEVKKAHIDGVKAGADFIGVKDFEVPETWNLFNRSNFKLNSKGKFKSHILKKKPEIDYLSD